MTHYKKLSLTGMPLNANQTQKLMEEKERFNQKYLNLPLSNHVYVTDQIQTILAPALLDQFDALGVTPAVIVNFSEYGQCYTTPIHADLTFYNDRWVPMGFGINWELAPGVTEFRWFDQNNQKPFMPIDFEEAHTWPRSMLNGTRYAHNDRLTQIDSLTFEHNTAYLVRTDIPHQVTSNTPGNFRECVSIRFRVDDISSWDQALKIFEPYFV